MSQSTRISGQLLSDARRCASVNSRSVPEQIKHWCRIGKIAEENPDLPYGFIKHVLLSRQEADAGELTGYRFG